MNFIKFFTYLDLHVTQGRECKNIDDRSNDVKRSFESYL